MGSRTKYRRLLLSAACGLLAAAVLASAATATHVGWHETATDGHTPVLGFTVDTFTLGATSWSARVTITNLSKRTIKLGDEYGVEIFANSSPATQHNKGLAFGQATVFSPARPTELKAGASWSGTIGGTGHPQTSSATRYARLVFGTFTGVPGYKQAILWVTNHALRLPGSGAGNGLSA